MIIKPQRIVAGNGEHYPVNKPLYYNNEKYYEIQKAFSRKHYYNKARDRTKTAKKSLQQF